MRCIFLLHIKSEDKTCAGKASLGGIEGIGGYVVTSTPPTRDVVENVSINLGLTGGDRLSVDDVVNTEDNSLTGSEKVREAREEVRRRKPEDNSQTYEDFYNSIIL